MSRLPLLARLSLLALSPTLALATPARAQEPPVAPKCPEQAAALPSELAPWTARTPLVAATRPEEAGKAELKLGAAVIAELAHTPEVTYAARPTKPGGSVAYGGLFHLVVGEAGTYRVALGNASWIDVVKDGEKVDSIAHGGGPACSGIRKIVNYPLLPGDYVVQLSAGGDAKTGVLVVKLP